MSGLISAAAIAAALGQFPPTDEQAAVIESDLEPALVVAGAGSGKTETMAGRVVWLVANGLVRRDQILGLTFTRKAAGELAERIQRRLARLAEFERRGLLGSLEDLHRRGELAGFGEIERSGGSDDDRRRLLDRLAERQTAAAGPVEDADDLLDRPTVSTYNSFADGIVREHAARIGRDAEAVVLSESAAWLLMRRTVLASDDPELETTEESLRTLVDRALRIARDAVDNLVDLDDLERFPERFARVVDIPSENARTTVYKDVQDDVAAVGKLALYARLAREYDRNKRRTGVIDFADQVAGAYEIVRGDPRLVDELREQYRVVLLDEYQDTSVVQSLLLSTLFADSAVMAVGDPHQAIYGWRGASAGNLAGFGEAFSANGACARFDLLTSWRNAPAVLNAATAVLAPLAERSTVAVGTLRARPGADHGRVEIVTEPDLESEADAVARWFGRVIAARGAEGRPTTGAVLFRAKKHMPRFAEALARHGIPHRVLGLGGLLSTPEIVDIVSALRVVSDPAQGSALIRLLSGPRWAIGLADMAALNDLARRQVRAQAAGESEPDLLARLRQSARAESGSLIDALDLFTRLRPDHAWFEPFSPAARDRLREAAAVFAGLRQVAATLPLTELVRAIEVELRLDIELAANESRGPARTAAAQIRAFVDEVNAFLAADEHGSLQSLLAWLEHAERSDDLAPRADPPESDVVQLLTIHGSKGLEWDAVAVVRVVEGELPSTPKETRGWLGAGVLPYAFRGDSAWLPSYPWQGAESQQQLRDRRIAFVDAHRDRALEEDRRLAYVAVTRARDHLLLSGSPWAGTTKPRELSRFTIEIAEALGHDDPRIDPGEDPPADTTRTLHWPMDALGSRRPRVTDAAQAVEAAREHPAEADDELALLLAERAERLRPARAGAPVRIPASAYKDFVADYDAAVAALERPMPERPYRQTSLGTRFHAWVERRSGVSASASLDDPLFSTEIEQDADDADFARLVAIFEASEWATLQPIEVETEIDFRYIGIDDRPHVVVCKLDAVYRRGDRIEIVDWKTGRAPRSESERRERLVQLELYRQAYHARHGIPIEQIDVALYYVADDLVIRD
ncbi:ATP-dependent DNA helicase [Microbacterium sp. Clip185]|uniref:ATP-dependent DNA helicase n=1 Tax=Microbacterium sp. Clip185 TaxID=3025663 RepID=UPI0023657D45|nr:ATP-dependent DNA helicase [Microbacterium sp. Clip185]WDG16918.1 ATP-dependent DNA helicase [Microbacterium sp. Clip185]